MTNTSNPQPPSLKVVPPAKMDAQTQKKQETPVQEAIAPPEKKGTPWGRLLLLLGLAGGLFAVSQVEVTTSVRGKGQLKPLPENLQYVYLDEPGRILNFMVADGEPVESGTILAQVQSQDLKDEIMAEEIRLAEEEAKLTTASQEIAVLTHRDLEAQQRVRAARETRARVEDDVARLSSSSPPPRIERITHEIKSMDSQIAGLERTMTHQNNRLDNLQVRIERLGENGVIEEGALSVSYQEDLQERVEILREQINSSISRIEELRNRQQAKQAEIDTLAEDKERKLEDLDHQFRSEEAQWRTIEQELEAAQAAHQAQVATVQKVKERIAQLKSQQLENRELESPISGIIFAQDLSEKRGKWLDRHDPVLQIANLNRLKAEIAFHQADADLIQEIVERGSAQVELKPIQPGYPTEIAKVSNMKRFTQPDDSAQTQELILTATVNNGGEKGLINSEFYAEIEVGKMPLYQRVQRELTKVLKLRQHF